MFNKLLNRQLHKHFGDAEWPEELTSFLNAISSSYDHYDIDRSMLERSLELSSAEMISLNTKLIAEGESLKIINDRLEDAQKIACLGIMEIDFIDNTTVYSQEFCNILDISSSNTPLSLNDFICCLEPSQQEQFTALIAISKQNTQAFSIELKLLTKKGNTKILYVQGNVVTNSSGEVENLIAIAKDITERKKSESVLKESEERYKNLIEQSKDLIQSFGNNGELLFVNSEWKEVMGYTDAEITNLKVFDIIAPESLNECMQEFHKVVSGEDLRNINAVFITKHGKKVLVEGNISPNIVNGKVSGSQGFFRDVTERKAAEDEIKLANDELTKKSCELDKFVYSVSHDLRAPLSSILGMVQLTEEDLTDSLAKENLGYVKKSILKLDNFIQDILAYSRNAKTEITKRAINFESMLGEIKNNLSYMEGANNEVVIITRIEQLEDFYCDESRLSIVMSNLISNGIRYRNPDTGTPYIEITVSATKDKAKIIVSDNGIGIKSELQEKIFEMFYRISGSSAGTGLGLYLVKETIDKLGGSISVDSEPGVGTKFTIEL